MVNLEYIFEDVIRYLKIESNNEIDIKRVN